jgi:UvrD-like helicase C-terminal domain
VRGGRCQFQFHARGVQHTAAYAAFVSGRWSDAREVRIFDVQHIKGMEFEAVFFVGIDRLAERIPGLFLRFLYGVTRAATYLGLTCETVLPKRLEPVRPHFATTSWTDA